MQIIRNYTVHILLWWDSCFRTKSDISYLKEKTARPSNPYIQELSWQPFSVICSSVGITSSCSLLAFPLSVSLASLCLRCLCFSVSQTHNCIRRLIVATPVLQQSNHPKSTKVKSHGNNVHAEHVQATPPAGKNRSILQKLLRVTLLLPLGVSLEFPTYFWYPMAIPHHDLLDWYTTSNAESRILT